MYELPSMQLLANEEGKKKSITIDHIEQWQWAPHRNLLVYTCVPVLSKDEKAKTNIIDPRVGFMKIPQRSQIQTTNFKDSEKLIMYMHPQGYYLAIANLIQKKKKTEWVVEIFDIEKGDMVPHQQIAVKRDVLEFSGIYWEPLNRKIAIHTLAKKETEKGKTEYTLEPKRHGVDIYEMTKDTTSGFGVKLIGYHPADKVQGLVWSSCGDIFALQERDGPSTAAKTVWSFYIIEEMTEQAQDTDEIKPIIRGKGGK